MLCLGYNVGGQRVQRHGGEAGLNPFAAAVGVGRSHLNGVCGVIGQSRQLVRRRDIVHGCPCRGGRIYRLDFCVNHPYISWNTHCGEVAPSIQSSPAAIGVIEVVCCCCHGVSTVVGDNNPQILGGIKLKVVEADFHKSLRTGQRERLRGYLGAGFGGAIAVDGDRLCRRCIVEDAHFGQHIATVATGRQHNGVCECCAVSIDLSTLRAIVVLIFVSDNGGYTIPQVGAGGCGIGRPADGGATGGDIAHSHAGGLCKLLGRGEAHGVAPLALLLANHGAHLGGVSRLGRQGGQREGVAVGNNEVRLVVVQAYLPLCGLAVFCPAQLGAVEGDARCGQVAGLLNRGNAAVNKVSGDSTRSNCTSIAAPFMLCNDFVVDICNQPAILCCVRAC